jgi:hypothetical protein
MKNHATIKRMHKQIYLALYLPTGQYKVKNLITGQEHWFEPDDFNIAKSFYHRSLNDIKRVW